MSFSTIDIYVWDNIESGARTNRYNRFMENSALCNVYAVSIA